MKMAAVGRGFSHLILICVIVGTLLFLTGRTDSPLRDPVSAAISAIYRGEHAKARAVLEPLANAGDARAQEGLAMAHVAANNQEEAVRWFLAAAAAGQEHSQLEMVVRYDQGRGVPRDPDEAARWLERLVTANPKSDKGGHMYDLGIRYLQGNGVPRKTERAWSLLRGAGDAGTGEGYLMLAESGSRPGSGMPTVEVLVWAELALRTACTDPSSGGLHDTALLLRDQLRDTLSPRQVEQSLAMAQELRPDFFDQRTVLYGYCRA